MIKVAHYFAGLSLGEADVLRRGMSGKFRSREEFDKAKDKFFSNCNEQGYPQKLTAEIWRQTASFAGYAFAKGHSASYAVESYQSLFLKAYYPLEYMVATINNFGGFYRTEFYIHEAKMDGATVEEPCVNRSNAETVIQGKTIFLGFGLVKSIEHKSIKSLLIARSEEGVFTSIQDFVKRVKITLDQLILFIRCNGFRFLGASKKQLLWEAHLLLGQTKKSKPKPRLFEPEVRLFSLPPLYTAQHEDAFDQIELFGYPLSDPFVLIESFPAYHIAAKDFPEHKNKTITAIGYLVTIKPTKTSKGDLMYFGTFIDRNGDWIDSVHFPPSAKAYPFRGRGVYAISGKVTEEFGCYSIETSQLEKLPMMPDPRYAEAKTVTQIRNQEGLMQSKRSLRR